jgi:thiosulfate dehydrogenase [quinone] large subunit
MQENFEDPPIAKFLFGNTNMAWLWLLVRVYVGFIWLMAGWAKLGSPVWTGEKSGVALSGFVKGALAKTAGEHPDVSAWYAWFLEHLVLPHASTWAHIVTYGELVVGISLILGIFTGIAAFFGLFMNFNFLFAGAVSVNPLLVLLTLGLVLAWKICGYWGLDRLVLPALGTPWRPGKIFSS